MVVSGGWGWRVIGSAMKEFSVGDGDVQCLDHGLGCMCNIHAGPHELVHLRFVHFIFCKFYLKRNKNKPYKYWTLVDDMHVEILGKKIYWCLQLTWKCIQNKMDC